MGFSHSQPSDQINVAPSTQPMKTIQDVPKVHTTEKTKVTPIQKASDTHVKSESDEGTQKIQDIS